MKKMQYGLLLVNRVQLNYLCLKESNPHLTPDKKIARQVKGLEEKRSTIKLLKGKKNPNIVKFYEYEQSILFYYIKLIIIKSMN